MKYRNQIPEPGTTISGFANSLKKKKKKKINADRPTLDFFDNVTVISELNKNDNLTSEITIFISLSLYFAPFRCRRHMKTSSLKFRICKTARM
jgi:DNA-binding MltR family transcriptional regulator